ncbi:MAG: tetratricopeptide repeat protein [Planctomycetota bacterium]|jgi:tetratricopeptide (TPR) repeat protein
MTRLASLIVLLAAAQPATAPDLLQSAQDAFTTERYQEALDHYDQLRELYPQEAGIPYNMGVAAYRLGDLQKAAELFDQARTLAVDPALRARSAYNLGTTAYRKSLEQPQDPNQAATQIDDATSDLKQALEHFRQSIDADPADLDARANGELAYRWLEQLQQMQEQMQQQQQGENQENQEQQEQQDQQQQQQQGDQQQDQQPQEQQQQQQADEQQQEPEQAQEDERDAEAQRKPMSREEAQRLLQQVRDKERRRREELARQEADRQPPVDKDW